MIARKGEQIICTNGHDCGSVTKDVQDGEIITGSVLRIKGGKDATRDGHIGHICATCREVVTEAREGRFRIHTARGRLGA